MAGEPNGGGKLDRIEALLDKMADRLDKVATMGYLHDEQMTRIETGLEKAVTLAHLHDERLRRIEANTEGFQANMKAMNEAYDKRFAEQNAAADKRVADLVGAIRDLIDRIPPDNLRKLA